MGRRLPGDRRVIGYIVVTAAFWLAAWVFWDGTGRTHSSSVDLGLQGPVINGLLLIPLLRGREWARWILVAMAVLNAVVIATLGVPPFGPTFGLLAPVALLQVWFLLPPGRFTGRGPRAALSRSSAE
jgi:hypothetical protein